MVQEQDNWYLFALFNERTIDGDLHLHFLMLVFRDSNGTRFVRQNISANGLSTKKEKSSRGCSAQSMDLLKQHRTMAVREEVASVMKKYLPHRSVSVFPIPLR